MQTLRALAMCLVSLAVVAEAGAQPAFEVVHSFGRGPAEPSGALLEASNGRLYGTTRAGGRFDGGTAFMIEPGASGGLPITLMHSFGGDGGRSPWAPLIEVDGAVYGTTHAGGAHGYGTVFRMTFDGAVTTIHHFDGFAGAHPVHLIRARDGHLYGVTRARLLASGALPYTGTIFRISTAGAFTTLHQFSPNGIDLEGGAEPLGLTQAPDGTFYGVTQTGGSWAHTPFPYGTVFKFTEAGVFTLVHSFTTGGYHFPSANLIWTDGALYGITQSGPGQTTPGAAFRMTADGTLTFIHQFTGDEYGARLFFRDTDGTFVGGTQTTVFRMMPSGAVTTLRRFSAIEGVGIISGLKAADGRLYGLAADSGLTGRGATFSMTVAGSLIGLNPFIVDDQPAQPVGSLVAREDGTVFGVSCRGGLLNAGTVYRRSPAGVITTLHSFFFLDGLCPYSLIRGSDGFLYGIARFGGLGGRGTVFRMDDAGAFALLHTFTGADGAFPDGLTQARNGQLWGTTYSGAGRTDAAGIFRLSTSGTLVAAYPLESGCYFAQLGPQAPDGSFYGSTRYCPNTLGTLFRITESGAIETFFAFDGFPIGYRPGPLMLASDGKLYGTLEAGSPGSGAIFAADPEGHVTAIHTFSPSEGEMPRWGLTEGLDGHLYGTTLGPGAIYDPVAPNVGTVFSTTTSGSLTVLHAFSYERTGSRPFGPLTRAPDGSIFGTTFLGGPAGQGVLFRIVTNGAGLE